MHEEWLMTYPGIGFVVSTSKPKECLHLFRRSGLSAIAVGEIASDREIWVSYRKMRELFLDLKRQSVFGVAR
jgi:selenophosphate synthetase-related protein